jgi:molybdopterin converting factor small subunit
MQVEFLGVPRERAGVSHLDLHADTLGELLGALVSRIPSLGELIADGRLHPSVIANLNGGEFVRDPKTPLRAGDHVLILSADVGG